MRIGILGGTFDPVHYGHLLIAETCRDLLRLDQVRFVPALQSPLKADQPGADGHARADMIQLAVAGCPAFLVDRRELRRSPPSWTLDTLQSFRAEFPGADLVLLMGADSLKDLSRWKQPEEIVRIAEIAACNRPGQPELTAETIASWIGPDLGSRVTPVQIPGTDISSTEIRQRIRSNRSIRFLTPRAVEAFLLEHRLYASRER